jgi:hypothetical protein
LPNFTKTKRHAKEGENKEQKERTHFQARKKVIVMKDEEGEHMVEFFIYCKWTLYTSS